LTKQKVIAYLLNGKEIEVVVGRGFPDNSLDSL
jgi:hypothetical protein